VTGAVALNGTLTKLPATTPGQNARFTFSTLSNKLRISFTGAALNTGSCAIASTRSCVTWTVLRNGTRIASFDCTDNPFSTESPLFFGGPGNGVIVANESGPSVFCYGLTVTGTIGP
jgi:hypothetical protein